MTLDPREDGGHGEPEWGYDDPRWRARWEAGQARWEAGRARWEAGEAGQARRRRSKRHGGPGPGVGIVGCLIFGLVLVVGTITALATWLAGSVLGLLSPDAAPSRTTAVAVVIVITIAILVVTRIFTTSIRPLADIASATRRLGDGEAGVRVRPRGPRPVRSLGHSFNAMAERLDRSRDDRQAMLADITHELRTPLTVVAGGLEAMLDGVHPMDEDHLAPLLAETGVMERLLEDLRTLSLAEAGALTLHREPCDLAALAADVLAAHRPGATAKGVTLRHDGEARLVASVDPVRAREILGNLVANAVRHTPSGGRVTVTVQAARGLAILEVADTGDGIPPADLARVFDRFERRVDSGGSGLGLAIVRDLVGAHGGTVEAFSTGVPGEGARFRVELPVQE